MKRYPKTIEYFDRIPELSPNILKSILWTNETRIVGRRGYTRLAYPQSLIDKFNLDEKDHAIKSGITQTWCVVPPDALVVIPGHRDTKPYVDADTRTLRNLEKNMQKYLNEGKQPNRVLTWLKGVLYSVSRTVSGQGRRDAERDNLFKKYKEVSRPDTETVPVDTKPVPDTRPTDHGGLRFTLADDKPQTVPKRKTKRRRQTKPQPKPQTDDPFTVSFDKINPDKLRDKIEKALADGTRPELTKDEKALMSLPSDEIPPEYRDTVRAYYRTLGV